MCAGLCSVSDNGVMVFPSPSKGHVQVVVSDGDMPVPPPDLAFLAVSTFSPIGSLSSNGMRICVCVCGWNELKYAQRWHIHISVHSILCQCCSFTHAHTHPQTI